MKLPSLVKLPSHKKFTYEPRFFDPIKEEIDERTERIRREVEAESRITQEQRSRFKAEWQHAVGKQDEEEKRAAISRLIFILLFTLTAVGYFFYGNNALYIGLILIPAYIFLRVRQMRKNS